MARILVVEDHENLRSSLRSCFESEGFDVLIAENLQTARLKIKDLPDLVVLDWMLPDGQGIDLLVDLRKTAQNIPVVFLTARVDTVDKVIGLELGASDYITKPFEPRELVARVRARLRERSPMAASSGQAEVLRVGELTIDRIKHKVNFRNSDVELVKKEYDLLVLFAENPEKVFSRDEILNKVWGYEVYPTTRTVDTHVMLLRQKVHNDLIETVRSVGYKFKPL
jgi:DNA-binding response OmpR family regulator